MFFHSFNFFPLLALQSKN
ncbi:MAG: CRISPR-associated DxTHG motif protein [Treponema sp.]|nr:CRISPR-associated DxTHG motif protein [Treponema sp.]